MDNEARILLDDTIEFCRRDGQDGRLINMLEQSTPCKLTDDRFTIEAPSRFAHTYLEKQREVVERYLEQITFAPMALEVTSPTPVAAQGGDSGTAARGVRTATGHGQPAAAHAPAPASPSAWPPNTLDTEPTGSMNAAEGMGPTPAPRTDKEAKGGISVTNTLSPDAFRKMMAQMKAEDGAPAAPASPTAASVGSSSAPAAEDYPSVSVSSKFTFDNFVFGDENMHAYQSAMRFAAFAATPGQCTSLFIYGSSGLGKTHLLFAIKNHLAQERPDITVKYASSQVYIDDYMRDLGMQKGPGQPIMREYRDADVLIIDDIQNIIGRQASIEFFFQLVDEFIRSGKKIVIASDRAPKKLGLDERLTSRFNSGMLCLVSEPGFEMKYTILKRYYENIIMGSGDLAHMNVDTSLLSALQVNEGHLSDEQLRHMAEISGNNIRELESFCERCAGLSSEREADGRELTGEDIDRIAEEYFDTARKVIHVDTVQRVVEEYYHVSHEDLIGPKRSKEFMFPRHVAVYLTHSLCGLGTQAIGDEFGGRHHATVINSLKAVESKMKEDRHVCEELQDLKNKILLKS